MFTSSSKRTLISVKIKQSKSSRIMWFSIGRVFVAEARIVDLNPIEANQNFPRTFIYSKYPLSILGIFVPRKNSHFCYFLPSHRCHYIMECDGKSLVASQKFIFVSFAVEGLNCFSKKMRRNMRCVPHV